MSALPVPSPTSTEQNYINYLFVGNPGVGKSSLINSLLAQVIFKAGISVGKGLTYEFQSYIDDGNQRIFMDTPGLSDVELRKQAAQAIDKALKTGGVYKIFFIVTVESGRVRPDDLTTIQLVCEAIGEKFEYALVVNKLSASAVKKLNENLEKFSESFSKFPFHKHYFLQKIEELEDQDNMTVPLPENFVKFVWDFPAFKLDSTKRKDVSYESFDSIKNSYEEQIRKLQKKFDEQAKNIKKFKENYEALKAQRERNEKMIYDLIKKQQSLLDALADEKMQTTSTLTKWNIQKLEQDQKLMEIQLKSNLDIRSHKREAKYDAGEFKSKKADERNQKDLKNELKLLEELSRRQHSAKSKEILVRDVNPCDENAFLTQNYQFPDISPREIHSIGLISIPFAYNESVPHYNFPSISSQIPRLSRPDPPVRPVIQQNNYEQEDRGYAGEESPFGIQGVCKTTNEVCRNCSNGRGCRYAGSGMPGHNNYVIKEEPISISTPSYGIQGVCKTTGEACKFCSSGRGCRYAGKGMPGHL
jgi:GTP-binding protein EngB required for normal cell division